MSDATKSFEEMKADNEAEILTKTRKALAKILQHLEEVNERKVLGVVFGVVYADGEEIDDQDEEGTAYVSKALYALAGPPEAIGTLLTDLLDKAVRGGDKP